MEQGGIAKASAIRARDRIGCAMGDAASCLVFGPTRSMLNKDCTDVQKDELPGK